MLYFVYVLKSLNNKKTYVEYTNNLENRLNEHNNGESVYTKRFKPWKIIYTETFNNKLEAINRERYFKSTSGRRWMKQNLFG